MIFKPYIPRALFIALLLVFGAKGYFYFTPAISSVEIKTSHQFIGPSLPEWHETINYRWPLEEEKVRKEIFCDSAL